MERGVYNAKKTVVFLTKHFLASESCSFQANLAVVRYIHTWGVNKHRVIVVKLEACKVPKYLKYFKCVYAWGYQDRPDERLDKIYTEVTGGKLTDLINLLNMYL